LALFGRRLPQRVDRPASRRPKTSTNSDINQFLQLDLFVWFDFAA
jgi:hypothetical protein